VKYHTRIHINFLNLKVTMPASAVCTCCFRYRM